MMWLRGRIRQDALLLPFFVEKTRKKMHKLCMIQDFTCTEDQVGLQWCLLTVGERSRSTRHGLNQLVKHRSRKVPHQQVQPPYAVGTCVFPAFQITDPASCVLQQEYVHGMNYCFTFTTSVEGAGLRCLTRMFYLYYQYEGAGLCCLTRMK